MSATGRTTSTATKSTHAVTYNDLEEDDTTGHTSHSSIAWICHVCDCVNYS